MDPRAFNLPRYLSVLPLFQEMNPAELERLAEGCSLRRLARGEMVFRCGEPCEAFHVTVTGQVKLFALSSAGQEKVIELIRPRQQFCRGPDVHRQALLHQRAGADRYAAADGGQARRAIPST